MSAEFPLTQYRWSDLADTERERLLTRGTERIFDPALREEILKIVEDVRDNGDDAVIRALKTVDGCDVAPGGLLVSEEEFAAASVVVSEEVKAALEVAIDHITRFNQRLMADTSWKIELDPGLEVGEKASPIPNVGLFVPSGKGSFPSSLTQIATPAVVAGVKEISIAVPPVPGSTNVDPALLVAAQMLGIENVFRVNGPAGVAALGFGTESVPQCVKVLGPGSPPVQVAQIELQRFGCHTLMLMGPTESLTVADNSADPFLLALDLLIEAEHGTDSSVFFITPDEGLLAEVQRETTALLDQLPEPRQSYARAALGEMGGAVLVADLDEAATVANLYAPEHMLVVVEDEDEMLSKIQNAGEILLGQSTPFSAANYVLGVPAALPTGRYARVTSGVTARTFTKFSSVAKATPAALESLGDSIVALADHEGFPAHGNAIRERRLKRENT